MYKIFDWRLSIFINLHIPAYNNYCARKQPESSLKMLPYRTTTKIPNWRQKRKRMSLQSRSAHLKFHYLITNATHTLSAFISSPIRRLASKMSPTEKRISKFFLEWKGENAKQEPERKQTNKPCGQRGEEVKHTGWWLLCSFPSRRELQQRSKMLSFKWCLFSIYLNHAIFPSLFINYMYAVKFHV